MKFGQVTDMQTDKNRDPFLEPQRAVGVGKKNKIPGDAFAINTSCYDQLEVNNPEYHIGLGAITDGVESLSSFTKAAPGMIVDVQPVVKFWVGIGCVEKNNVVTFTDVSATAALCDATSGKRNFKVTRTSNGKWHVTGK